jgi:hypothetical protein
MKDPIVAKVIRDLQERSAVGIKKYGVTLARTDLDLIDWLQHAYEETLDQANYLQCAIQSLQARREIEQMPCVQAKTQLERVKAKIKAEIIR